MREIKFRAWDKDNNEMFPKEYSLIKAILNDMDGKSYKIEIANFMPDGGWEFEELENIELIQYTGLKDKNGVEIYEGDIFSPDGIPVYVEYDEYELCFILKNEDWEKPFNRIGKIDTFEVIGNIYENPELLGEQNDKT